MHFSGNFMMFFGHSEIKPHPIKWIITSQESQDEDLQPTEVMGVMTASDAATANSPTSLAEWRPLPAHRDAASCAGAQGLAGHGLG